MTLKPGELLTVIICALICLSYNAPAKKKTDSYNNCIIQSDHMFNNSNDQMDELYTEILGMINIDKKKDNVKIDMNTRMDSSLICFDKIKTYVEGKVIRIFYHDSANVYFNFEDLHKYLEENNYQAVNSCMADGPDGTHQVYLKNRVMLLFTGQWDGGDDSDTTYVPSEYFELNFYLIELNQPDPVIKSNMDK